MAAVKTAMLTKGAMPEDIEKGGKYTILFILLTLISLFRGIFFYLILKCILVYFRLSFHIMLYDRFLFHFISVLFYLFYFPPFFPLRPSSEKLLGPVSSLVATSILQQRAQEIRNQRINWNQYLQ